MKRNALNWLVCPHCAQGLTLETTEPAGDEVLAGSLNCPPCHRAYPVEHGVPNLVARGDDGGATGRAFGRQWTMQDAGKFEQDTIYGMTREEEFADVCRYLSLDESRAPVGGVFLEAGCGSGRLGETVAERFPEMQVFALDISDAVYPAFRRSLRLPNLHVLRGDLFALPFRENNFDRIWSEGVLHSTPDAKDAFFRLTKALAPGGRLYIWLYSTKFHPYRFMRDVLYKPYRIPPRALFWLCRALAVPLFAVYRLGDALGRGQHPHTFGEVVFGLHDNLAPEYQSRHTPAEVQGWFRDAGLDEVVLWETDLGASGRKPPVPERVAAEQAEAAQRA